MSVSGRSPIASPIFITGVYRSGTTLLSRMLDAHSQLAVTYDSVHFMRFCFGQFGPVAARENYAALVDDVKTRCEARWERPVDVAPILAELDSSEQVTYAAAYDAVMKHLLLREGKSRWGEKTQLAWGKIPAFLEMFPEGKAVLVLRDPRDIVASYRRFTTEPGLRYLDGAFACLSAMRAALRYRESLAPGSCMTIRYEDLAADPKATMERLSAALEVPFEPGMLDPGNFRDLTGGRWMRNSSYDGASAAISAESVARYREHLSDVEIFFTEMVDRCVMESFDYGLQSRPLGRNEWNELYEILSDEFIAPRFENWLRTNEGVESYPSPPPRVV